MTRSRHRRSEGSGEPASLPSWAQRHLDESGTSAGALAPATRHRRPARAVAARGPAGDSPLRGWGVAILSVAAAVTAVPLAISAVANDRSDDPMPTVDTFTAGAPGPLQGAGGAGAEASSGRGGTAGSADDPATAGVLPQPGAPAAAAPGPVVVPAPLPAAVVRPTTPPAPTTVTPRSAAPTSTSTTTPTRTTTSDEGKSATKPSTGSSTPTKSSSGGGGGGGSSSSGGSGSSSGSGSNSGSSKKQDGPVTGLVKGVGNTLGGVTGSLGL